MKQEPIRCILPDADLFAPFGSFIVPPSLAGERSYYSSHVGPAELGPPVLHTNLVAPSALPLTVERIERHPHAAQSFVPLDVDRYVVAVMPSDPSGNPRPELTLAFLVPGATGVIYHAGVWHLGATVIDRVGSFAVLMRRREDGTDDEFRQIDRLVLHQHALLSPTAP